MEKQTYVCTERREDTVPTPMDGEDSKLGNWKDSKEMDKELKTKFTGCMKGEASLSRIRYPLCMFRCSIRSFSSIDKNKNSHTLS